jgi:cytochrome c-type biogenesis protein CcmH
MIDLAIASHSVKNPGSAVSARRDIFSFVFRASALAIFVAALALTSPAQQSDRVKALGAKMFCACGCNQILTACNHVGCTYSTKMLQELNDRIGRGDSDDLILQSFVQEYGPTVLAQPPAKGFNALVWIMPVVLPIVAIILVWGVVQRWHERSALAPAGGPPVDPNLLARAHREAGESDE